MGVYDVSVRYMVVGEDVIETDTVVIAAVNEDIAAEIAELHVANNSNIDWFEITDVQEVRDA